MITHILMVKTRIKAMYNYQLCALQPPDNLKLGDQDLIISFVHKTSILFVIVNRVRDYALK